MCLEFCCLPPVLPPPHAVRFDLCGDPMYARYPRPLGFHSVMPRPIAPCRMTPGYGLHYRGPVFAPGIFPRAHDVFHHHGGLNPERCAFSMGGRVPVGVRVGSW
jgi:hypothetical protein